MKKPELTYDAALEKLQSHLKKPLEADKIGRASL